MGVQGIALLSHILLVLATPPMCNLFFLFLLKLYLALKTHSVFCLQPESTLVATFINTYIHTYRIYSNKRRIWDKKVYNCRPRISAAPPMRHLFEEFRITNVISFRVQTPAITKSNTLYFSSITAYDGGKSTHVVKSEKRLIIC